MNAASLEGPFGPARRKASLSTAHIAAMYETKCGFDVRPHFNLDRIDLYECLTTGYQFWRPAEIAGDEQFYRGLSAAWNDYYRDWRWEYKHVPAQVKRSDTLLEIGSGRGYFLRYIEGRVRSAIGLELNGEAATQKLCQSEIRVASLESFARERRQKFDVICSFQVLEHLPAPHTFLEACIGSLAPSGRLILSTPNYDHVSFQRQEDAFDLPPHHIGHFSPKVFAKLANIYGLQLQETLIEARQFQLAPVTTRTASSRSYRAMRYLIKKTGQLMYAACREPGASLLVVLRK